MDSNTQQVQKTTFILKENLNLEFSEAYLIFFIYLKKI